MAKVLQGVRFEPEEVALINEYAEFTGTSFSAVVRSATLEVIEDRIDAKELQQAINESSGKFLTLDEIEKDLL